MHDAYIGGFSQFRSCGTYSVLSRSPSIVVVVVVVVICYFYYPR